VTTK
jgi:transposase